MWMRLLFLFAGLALVSCSCPSPKVSSTHYTTTDAFFHMSSAFVVEFDLQCADGAKQLMLYADVDGKLLPVAVNEESNRYQVSWGEEHEKVRAGKYVIRLYDEDGYSAVRKSQRANEDSSKVQAVAEIEINHPGASKGPFAATETIMLLLSLATFYVALSWKSTLQA